MSVWKLTSCTCAEYYFATFNKTMTHFEYTDQEYTANFEDASWTKEETDKLFFLCNRLDTRFIAIADRLEGRSVEDVKSRYYNIARKLLDIRGEYNDDELASMPLYRFQYDKDYDVRRKAQLNQLHNRTKEDEAEEAKVLSELKALDETLKKDAKLRTKARKQAEAVQSAAFPPPWDLTTLHVNCTMYHDTVCGAQEALGLKKGYQEEEEEEELPARRGGGRETVTTGRPQREVKRPKRETAPSFKAQAAARGRLLVDEYARPCSWFLYPEMTLVTSLYLILTLVTVIDAGYRGELEEDISVEGRVKLKLHELGVDEWPLPVASVTIAHTALLDDINKLVALETQLRENGLARWSDWRRC
jgi:hypothetical protein